MNISVVGLWHLGCVTAGCCSKYFNVTGIDENLSTIENLRNGQLPIFEPKLGELIKFGLAGNTLSFTTDIAMGCRNADILWITYDTPINEKDESNIADILTVIDKCIRHLPRKALILISSQFPVGTCDKLASKYPQNCFAYSPENLRLGKSIEAFEKAARVIIGMNCNSKKELLWDLFRPFADEVIFMKMASAEMVKHALNSFLALSVVYINEIGTLCEYIGADAGEVSIGLKSDIRIGPRSYLNTGLPFSGGTLGRDVVNLTKTADRYGISLPIISSIVNSNESHKCWIIKKLENKLGSFGDKRIGVLGLTYTINTDTLRRSFPLEVCHQLIDLGCELRVFDDNIDKLPNKSMGMTLLTDIDDIFTGTDALIIFKNSTNINLEGVLKMRNRLIIDMNDLLKTDITKLYGADHIIFGK